MRNMTLLIIILVLTAISIYFMASISPILNKWPLLYKRSFQSIFFVLPVAVPLVTAWGRMQMNHESYIQQWGFLTVLMGIIVGIFGAILLADALFLIRDLFAGFTKWILGRTADNSWLLSLKGKKTIIYVVLTITGLYISNVAYGIAYGRFNYQARHTTLYFDKLPEAFDGYRILQFTDMHIGSFIAHPKKVEKAVRQMTSENADAIVFTGDMVNNTAAEAEPFIETFKQLKAKDGVFSVLGNHDYAEYIQFPSKEDRRNNLNRLKEIQKESGFNLLMNEHVYLKRGNDSIALIGIENWGTPPFPSYGDLPKASEGVSSNTFKVLLSHDPSHWKAKVIPESDVDLTLSGHTHGMQFGVRIGKYRWSPVKWRYSEWDGIYKQGLQVLHVSAGLGHIAFPGRVGILPEYNIIELKKR
ncbi:metallophosphoesterase [Puteibacter caeruleilacunae]|nr:metallophosphoesterase [Puteibacter caeruleilacunae]